MKSHNIDQFDKNHVILYYFCQGISFFVIPPKITTAIFFKYIFIKNEYRVLSESIKNFLVSNKIILSLYKIYSIIRIYWEAIKFFFVQAPTTNMPREYTCEDLTFAKPHSR